MHSTTIVNSGAHSQYHYRQQWCSCTYRWKIIKSSCNNINLAANTNKKDLVLKDLISGVRYKFQRGLLLVFLWWMYNTLDQWAHDVNWTYIRRPGRLLNVLCTSNLRSVSKGECKNWWIFWYITSYKKQIKPKNSSVTDNSVFRPFSILWQFSYANENKAFIRTEREPANNDRSTTFE